MEEALKEDEKVACLVCVDECLFKKALSSFFFSHTNSFQGEEAKVIVISLVRNHPQGRIGFLSIENRINVLLSRAKHGMFVGDIGALLVFFCFVFFIFIFDSLFPGVQVSAGPCTLAGERARRSHVADGVEDASRRWQHRPWISPEVS